MTNLYSRYVDLVSFIYSRNKEFGWDDKSLTRLKRMIRMFENHLWRVFQSYESFRMRALKWHGLDHLPENLCHTGGVEFLTRSLCERSHRLFKDMYGRASRRTSFEILETLRRHDRRAQREREKTDNANAEWLDESRVQSVGTTRLSLCVQVHVILY